MARPSETIVALQRVKSIIEKTGNQGNHLYKDAYVEVSRLIYFLETVEKLPYDWREFI